MSFCKKLGEAMGNVAESEKVSTPPARGRALKSCLSHGQVDRKFAGKILTAFEGSASFVGWPDKFEVVSFPAAGRNRDMSAGTDPGPCVD